MSLFFKILRHIWARSVPDQIFVQNPGRYWAVVNKDLLADSFVRFAPNFTQYLAQICPSFVLPTA